MLLNILFLLIGFVILVKGADILVEGASSAAKNLGISSLAIGLTIIAFGTSSPELAVSFKAISSSNGDIVIGNVIGSSISNILLILGISSLFGKIKVKPTTVKKEIPIFIIISLLFSMLFSDKLFNSDTINYISRSDAIAILLFFIIFIYYLTNIIKNSRKENIEIKSIKNYNTIKSLIFILLGLVGLILGSDLVVNSASYIAKSLGISERIISFTVIAIGTSLPELVSSIVSLKKGQHDIVIGNVIGSNIFNIGIVLALPVAIFGGISARSFTYIDLLVLITSSIILYLFAKNNGEISKIEGVLMLILYLVYYSYIIWGGNL